MSTAAEAAAQLEAAFGLSGVELRHGLSQDDLFHQAIAHDRGRVEPDGPDDAQKAFPTALGVDGPLVYFSDPSCTGRPVQDTFCVDRVSVSDQVWWKSGFAKFDPDKFDALLPRVIAHLNDRGNAELYVTDVFCGWDPDVRRAVPVRGRVCDARVLLQHHVPEGCPRRRQIALRQGWTMHQRPLVPSCVPERDGTKSASAPSSWTSSTAWSGWSSAGPTTAESTRRRCSRSMNYVLPCQGPAVDALLGERGARDSDSAILFGLSGTGKTTLSADPDRAS